MRGTRSTTGFMVETLNRTQCETVADAMKLWLADELRHADTPYDRDGITRRHNEIMRKIDMGGTSCWKFSTR